MAAIDGAAFNRLANRYSREWPPIGLFLLMTAAAIWIGVQARSRSATLGRQLHSLQGENARLVEWRRSFRAPDKGEAARLDADSALVLSIASRGGERMAIAQSIARVAEEAGLADVQINFGAPPDSTYVPPRGQIGQGATSVAPYVVTVDCTGSFASTLQFVSHVPSALSVTRVGAARGLTETRYRVVLSVYEVANGSRSE